MSFSDESKYLSAQFSAGDRVGRPPETLSHTHAHTRTRAHAVHWFQKAAVTKGWLKTPEMSSLFVREPEIPNPSVGRTTLSEESRESSAP